MRDDGTWTIGTVREHVLALLAANDRRYEQRFADQQMAVNAALSAAKEAVTKAEDAAERRFNSVNEFRATLGDQQRTLLPRSEYVAAHGSLIREIEALRNDISELKQERLGILSWIGSAVGVIAFLSLLGGLIALLLKLKG